ncbi:MAG: PDGLE domain-containing protein, partial [Clostridia bacterium]|nr:PDGLE domain-containing protein [Clostridia bacterium]
DLMPAPKWNCPDAKKADRLPLVKTLVVVLVAALAIGGGLSLLASSNPDGLEWSIFEQMQVDEENYGVTSSAASKAAVIQENLSFLPDYAFKENETVLGTVFSGIVGIGIILLFFIIVSILRKPKDKNRAASALYEISDMEELAEGNSLIHKLNPLLKLLITIVYIVCVVSFDKYAFVPLLLMALIPIVIYIIAGIKITTCFYKLRVIMPFILMVGIFNPIFEGSVGLVSMFTLMLKGVLSLMMSFIFVATTPIDKLCVSLRKVHFPKTLVTMLLLTYRYLGVLVREISIMTDAYHLRAPNQKGIAPKAWGSFLGQLLLRSMDKATEIYNSMLLRGYGVEVKK